MYWLVQFSNEQKILCNILYTKLLSALKELCCTIGGKNKAPKESVKLKEQCHVFKKLLVYTFGAFGVTLRNTLLK